MFAVDHDLLQSCSISRLPFLPFLPKYWFIWLCKAASVPAEILNVSRMRSILVVISCVAHALQLLHLLYQSRSSMCMCGLAAVLLQLPDRIAAL